MSNPTLIVTGASRGIGRSITLLAIQNLGANVIAVARSSEALQQLSSHIETDLNLKDRFKFVVGDVTAESTVTEALALAARSWSGQLDGLVLNAGVLEPVGPLSNTAVEDWKKAFDVNFFSVVTIVQHALPALRASKGRVVLVSSGAALYPYHGWGAYSSSKAALNMFGAILALEEPDITTVSIQPGVVDTEMQRVVREKGVEGMVPAQHAEFIYLHEHKALLHPDLPGQVIASLALKAPSSISGKFLAWDDESLSAHRKQ
ncbi:hypothetical protein EMPS_06594 [Entomortierella parvispora]|uniref:Ketoreductase domain-containing protein n=1 Tax=Entomortierella parvispora TaxID=205924 RepID=A0A9P3HCU5_9FUNG|nr:hypothetical protein EMPS_06594 [Entomortierella parvispora]